MCRITRTPATALAIVVLALAVVSCTEAAAPAVAVPALKFAAITQSGCSLTAPAFCETFDAPAGTGNRSGQLNGTVWGASRVTGNNSLSSPVNAWGQANASVCGTTQRLAPDNDIFVCNGQLVEGQDDDTGVTSLAMYPKQPFDFAGRTGKVTFDVANNSQGSHAAWPEFWISDKPVPTPFTHEASFQSVPQNGLGIRFAGYADASGHGASCPEGSPAYVGVDSAITVSNYVGNDTFNGGSLALKGNDCVKASTGPGQLNHYEIDISQSQIDIYGTDAGTTAPLKHLATIANANLSFSRGLIWIEDAHYNGSKFNTQGTNTFTWDNVGFDGPVLPRDLTYDVNDSVVPDGATDPNTGLPELALGWFVGQGTTHTFTVQNVVSPGAATGALLTFGFYYQASPPFSINYAINGHAHTLAWPFPDTVTYSPRTVGVPLVLSDLQAGTNTLAITPPVSMNVFNVDLAMIGAGGGGSGGTPVPTVPVPTATTVPTTPTPAPTVNTCQVLVLVNGKQQWVTKPIAFCMASP